MIDFWLNLVYVDIGKSSCYVNLLKGLRNDDDGYWKVLS